jgi:cell division protein FtsX
MIAEQLPFLKFDVSLPFYLVIYASMAVTGVLVGVLSSVIAIRRFLSE